MAIYLIQQVSGAGEWVTIGKKPTEKSAACLSSEAYSEHLRCYGQPLRHIESGRMVGDTRVLGPDGVVIDYPGL